MTAPPLEGPHLRQGTAGLAADEPGAGRDPVGIGPLYGPAPPPLAGPPIAAPSSPAAAPARHRDEVDPLNLAQRPFINTRPVVRAAAILYVLGLLLLALDVALFAGYLSHSRETRIKLAAGQKEVEHERGEVAKLENLVGSLSLDQQNREVTFLNRKIEERTFSWSLLLDRLSDVLPDDVRLLRLSPSSLVQKDTESAVRAGREPKPAPIALSMTCEAKSDEAKLRFVDNLFAHPAFAEPNLVSETLQENGLLRFEVTVQYQPHLPRRAASAGGASPQPAAGLSSSRGRRTSAAAADAAAPPPPSAEDGAPPPASSSHAQSPAGSSLIRMTSPPVAPPRQKRPPAPSAPSAPSVPPDGGAAAGHLENRP